MEWRDLNTFVGFGDEEVAKEREKKSDATRSQKRQSDQSVRKQPNESFLQGKIEDQILKSSTLIF